MQYRVIREVLSNIILLIHFHMAAVKAALLGPCPLYTLRPRHSGVSIKFEVRAHYVTVFINQSIHQSRPPLPRNLVNTQNINC